MLVRIYSKVNNDKMVNNLL